MLLTVANVASTAGAPPLPAVLAPPLPPPAVLAPPLPPPALLELPPAPLPPLLAPAAVAPAALEPALPLAPPGPAPAALLPPEPSELQATRIERAARIAGATKYEDDFMVQQRQWSGTIASSAVESTAKGCGFASSGANDDPHLLTANFSEVGCTLSPAIRGVIVGSAWRAPRPTSAST